MMNIKTDLTKTNPRWYKAGAGPEISHFDRAGYLSIEGKGDPSGPAFAQDLQALYPVAYALKFHYKARQQDFVVAKLEAQWHFDRTKYAIQSIDEAPLKIPRDEWQYRCLIRLPEFVDPDQIPPIITAVKKKKQLPGLEKVRYYELPESYFVQVLHTGPFDREPLTLKRLKQFMDEKGYVQNSLPHHEVYLTDFRKTPPERLRTILREGVE